MTRIDTPGYPLVGIRADNPGPLTLSGTNSWIVDRDPAWLVDPGPALADHVAAVVAELDRLGGLGGIALTHDHADHSGAVPAIRERFPGAPLAAARGEVEVRLGQGSRFGPLEAVRTPGHSTDHLAFVSDTIGLTGDAVLGEGSVFISRDPGALVGYLDALTRLRRRGLTILAPGHGPPIYDVDARLQAYAAHRLDRERKLIAALNKGIRGVDGLLDAAWQDVPSRLRPVAAITLAAHLDKLDSEGRLPAGVERAPAWTSP
jgi:glyoxylase-like metal-dependent hydrolase (beta-lactamase superfamily II)